MDEVTHKVTMFKVIYLTMLVTTMLGVFGVAGLWYFGYQLYAVLLMVIVGILANTITSKSAAREEHEKVKDAIRLGQELAHETLRESVKAIVENDRQDVKEQEATLAFAKAIFKMAQEMQPEVGQGVDMSILDSAGDDNITPFPNKKQGDGSVVNM